MKIGRGGRVPPNRVVIRDEEVDPPINLHDPIDAALNRFNPDIRRPPAFRAGGRDGARSSSTGHARGHRVVGQQDKDAHVIVLGDLNTFEFMNDLTDILPAASGKRILYNLVSKNRDGNDYSFIFEGNSQVLDHISATQDLAKGARFDFVHVNVDFARRSDDVVGSDNEPIVASFAFAKDEDDDDDDEDDGNEKDEDRTDIPLEIELSSALEQPRARMTGDDAAHAGF